MKKIIFTSLILILIFSCGNKLEKKGFQVAIENDEIIEGIEKDTFELRTRPKNILKTYYSKHRLSTIYKINYNKKTKTYFTGENYFHSNYSDGNREGNQWNNNFMPGFEAVYGYNMVNVSHFDMETKTRNDLFDKDVLIRTLYYPAFSKDTLNFTTISRNFYMVSVYDEDTNKDGFINIKDLRRFYYFDINGKNKELLIPNNFSVMSSEYDSENDFMYIYARIDSNKNGRKRENKSFLD